MADTPGTACEAMVTMNSGSPMPSMACHDHCGVTHTGSAGSQRKAAVQLPLHGGDQHARQQDTGDGIAGPQPLAHQIGEQHADHQHRL